MSTQATMTLATIGVLVISVVLHEISHGAMAYFFGDKTAQRAGRLTLNPISHIDLFGSVLLPGMLIATGAPFLFGYAKPVPVNFYSLRPQRLGLILVAAAGPLMNVVLAVASALLLHSTQDSFMQGVLVLSIQLNLVLAVFNMLPILPMDGGRVMFGLMPRSIGSVYARLEPYGMLIILLLLASPFILAQFGYHYNLLSSIISPMVKWLRGIVLMVAGV